MKFHGQAEQVSNLLLEQFAQGNLPAALAQVFISRKDASPCRKWSWSNQLLVALRGHSDARGFRQWQEVGRSVCKGEKAFYILAPCMAKRKDDATGEERRFLTGFRATPVFGLAQTDGEPLPGAEQDRQFVESLPLIEVAKAWGLKVTTFNGNEAGRLGSFCQGANAIALGVENISTWLHELMHAAEARLVPLKPGQQIDQEIVAEFGGAVLAIMLGRETEADKGGAYQYIAAYCQREDKPIVQTIMKFLDRVANAIALIMETAAGENAAAPEEITEEPGEMEA